MKIKIFISFLILFTAGIKGQDKKIKELILFHFREYPEMELQDFYKLAYQSCMGNEHMAPDSIMFAKYLDKEMESIEADDKEPLYSSISTNGELVRVNLRPVKAKELSKELLLNAMIKTSKDFKKKKTDIVKFFDALKQLSKKKAVPFKIAEIESYRKEMKSKGFPSVHHSDTYKQNYRPAYRVILKKYLEEKRDELSRKK